MKVLIDTNVVFDVFARRQPHYSASNHILKLARRKKIAAAVAAHTVANLFYNMGRRQVGLVGMWDVVAFDEVAGISFKDKDGIQIMKDYMASGSFARGRDSVNAYASMVFVGNINQPVDTLVKTSHLFAPFLHTPFRNRKAQCDHALLSLAPLHLCRRVNARRDGRAVSPPPSTAMGGGLRKPTPTPTPKPTMNQRGKRPSNNRIN